MSRRNIETEECVVNIIRETDKAYFLEDCTYSEQGDEDSQAWFPKSQIHFKQRNTKTNRGIAVIPTWLLREKGWQA